jgi:hypothetical protein
MLTTSKKAKMLNALKSYKKKFLDRNLIELDESGTRLMINTFLSDVLGYSSIEEIKTEYMIKGTYADYVIQTSGIRHFLVEVKALSFQLSEKHLRQTINYGANEGIEWALLTNGRTFEFYKILFNKPIESRKIFSVDLSDGAALKSVLEHLQYLHKDAIFKKSLKLLWNRFEALFPENVAGILYSKEVIGAIKKLIKVKYGEKCDDDEVVKSLGRIICEKFDLQTIKPYRSGKTERKPRKLASNEAVQISSSKEVEKVEDVPPSGMN